MSHKQNGAGRYPRCDSGSSAGGTSVPKHLTLESIEMNLTRSASQLLALHEARATKHRPDACTTSPSKAEENEHLNPDVVDLGTPSNEAAGSEGVDVLKSFAWKKAELTNKIIKTVILYSGVFILGLQWGVIGPSLPDLEEVTGASTSYISLVLTGRNIAALAGSALAGFLVDRYNNWLLLGLSQILLGVLFAAAPWGRDVIILAICMIPSGLAAGFYDTGVNVAVLRVWDGKPGPWIQGMECIDAIGSFIAPLIVQPFLVTKVTNPWEEEAELQLNQSSNDWKHIASGADVQMTGSQTTRDVHLGNHTSSAINQSPYITYGSNFDSPYSDNNTTVRLHPQAESHVMFAYLVVGVLLVFVAAGHFSMLFQGKCYLKLTQKTKNDETVLCSSLRNKQEQRIRVMILPLLFFICFAYYALETGYAHYLMTFCVKHLEWDKSSGVAVTSAFWGSYTAGTAIGIVIIRFVRPRTLLLFDVTLCVLSQIFLTIFLDYHSAVVWVCTIFAGLSIATIFASVFSWAQKNIGVTGKVNALMMMGMSLGEMTSPAIIGILIDRSGTISWVYCMLGAASLCAIVLIVMQLLATKLKHIRNLEKGYNNKTIRAAENNVKIRILDEINMDI